MEEKITRDVDIRIPRGTTKTDRMIILLSAIAEHGPDANLSPRIDRTAAPALPNELSTRELRKLRKKR